MVYKRGVTDSLFWYVMNWDHRQLMILKPLGNYLKVYVQQLIYGKRERERDIEGNEKENYHAQPLGNGYITRTLRRYRGRGTFYIPELLARRVLYDYLLHRGPPKHLHTQVHTCRLIYRYIWLFELQIAPRLVARWGLTLCCGGLRPL